MLEFAIHWLLMSLGSTAGLLSGVHGTKKGSLYSDRKYHGLSLKHSSTCYSSDLRSMWRGGICNVTMNARHVIAFSLAEKTNLGAGKVGTVLKSVKSSCSGLEFSSHRPR